MLKILLASDFHFDYCDDPIENIVSSIDRDLTVFLGDFGKIHHLYEFERFIEYQLQYSDVLYVLGNHEFLSYDHELVPIEISNLFYSINQNSTHNAYLLHNQTRVLSHGIKFICSTLRSKLDLTINEILQRSTRPLHHIQEHIKAVNFIEQELISDIPTIVLTHYAPSLKSIAPKYQNSALNSAYASNLEHLMIGENSPLYWMHGHVHNSVNYKVGSTTVLSNPHGYRGENEDYNPSYLVDITDF